MTEELKNRTYLGDEPSPPWWICNNCGYGWSSMMGDNEVPEICECGGSVVENEETSKVRYYVEILDYDSNRAHFYIRTHSTDEIRSLIDCRRIISIETTE